MKNYVTGWRQVVRKEIDRAQRQDAPPVPAAPAAAPAPAPAAAPPAKRPPRAAAPARGEVIDAAPARPQRPIVVPSFGIPRMPIQWLFFGGFAFMLLVSTEATHDLAQSMWPGASNLWWKALAAQMIISSIERAFFAGNRNLFTMGVFVADAIIVGVGIGIAMLPGFFSSGVWGFLAAGSELATYQYNETTFIGKLLAIAVGAFVAWSGDAMLDLAVRGR